MGEHDASTPDTPSTSNDPDTTTPVKPASLVSTDNDANTDSGTVKRRPPTLAEQLRYGPDDTKGTAPKPYVPPVSTGSK